MLGILLIYFIGKYYYDLAILHNKSKWGFGVLGVIVYYAGTTIFGVVAGVSIAMLKPELLDTVPELVWSIVALPFGILATWGLYRFLKKKWENQGNESLEDILDSGL